MFFPHLVVSKRVLDLVSEKLPRFAWCLLQSRFRVSLVEGGGGGPFDPGLTFSGLEGKAFPGSQLRA